MGNATKGFQHDNRAQIGATNESLWNKMVQIRKDETTIVSSAPTVTVGDQVHMWSTKTPRTIGDRASVQGADPTFDNTDTGRTSNFTQLFEVGYEITGSRAAADAVGMDPMAQEKFEALKDTKDFMEFAVVRGSLVSGNDSTAAKLKGMKQFASTLATSQSGVSLNENTLNDYMALSWEQGFELDTFLAGRVLKGRISGFTASNTKEIAVEDFKTVRKVNVYEGDFATVMIKKHRYVTQSGDTNFDLLGYDSSYIHMGIYRAPQFTPLAKTGDAERGMVVSEVTLQVDNESSIVSAVRHL